MFAVKGVTLTPETLVLKPEEVAVLSAAVTPADATIKDIVWLSENESVAVVDASGTVTAVNEELGGTPTLLNASCYGTGWIIKAKPDDMADLDGLLSADAYRALLAK